MTLQSPDENRFSILPVDVLLDHRLTLIETRVLGAILSFRSKNTNVSWPSREQISERCGYSTGTISNATKTLVKKGWLRKKKAVFNGPNEYEVTVPEAHKPALESVESHRTSEVHQFGEECAHQSSEVHRSGDVHRTDEHEPHRTGEHIPHRSGEPNLPRRDQGRDQGEEEAASRPLSTEKTTRPTPVPSPTKTPQCPQEEILALYHEILPEMTVHRDWTPTRRKHLAARWASDTRRQNLDYWRDLFEWIRESDFLMGRVTGIGGKPFRCSLEWIVNQSNFTKITERKYHEDRAA